MILKFLTALAITYIMWRVWHGFGTRKSGTPIPPPPRPVDRTGDTDMARQLLGVGSDADDATIRAAHRRLMKDAHPDHGGSDEATRALNSARDTLLKRPNR